MKKLALTTLLLLSSTVFANDVKFVANLTFEKCWMDNLERVCELNPYITKEILLDLSSNPYGFEGIERTSDDGNARFNTVFSVVRWMEEGFYDVNIALQTKAGQQEDWTFAKIRVKRFDDILTQMSYEGRPVKRDGFEYKATLQIERY